MISTNKLPFEWLVGLRYTRAGKRSGRNGFISFISLISVAGIALGVAALIVVLSVMNGFQKDVTRPHAVGAGAYREFSTKPVPCPTGRPSRKPRANPAVLGAAPFVETQGCWCATT
jgi:lipoprotein-releasing system permease protein